MKKVALILVSGALVMACGPSQSRTDSGPSIMLMDSGPGTDAPTVRRDSPASTCPPLVLDAPPATGDNCTAATLMCISDASMAMDSAALQACLDADTGCEACINNEILSCASMNGCDQALGDAECCLDEACPDGDDACVQAAFEGACMTDVDAFYACVQDTIGATCGINPSGPCFPAAGGFLPGRAVPQIGTSTDLRREVRSMLRARAGR